MAERETSGGLIALGAGGMAVCCGLPLLLSAGALGVLAGIGLGSWLPIAAGLAIAVVVLWRFTRHPCPSQQDRPAAQPDRIHQ